MAQKETLATQTVILALPATATRGPNGSAHADAEPQPSHPPALTEPLGAGWGARVPRSSAAARPSSLHTQSALQACRCQLHPHLQLRDTPAECGPHLTPRNGSPGKAEHGDHIADGSSIWRACGGTRDHTPPDRRGPTAHALSLLLSSGLTPDTGRAGLPAQAGDSAAFTGRHQEPLLPLDTRPSLAVTPQKASEAGPPWQHGKGQYGRTRWGSPLSCKVGDTLKKEKNQSNIHINKKKTPCDHVDKCWKKTFDQTQHPRAARSLGKLGTEGRALGLIKGSAEGPAPGALGAQGLSTSPSPRQGEAVRMVCRSARRCRCRSHTERCRRQEAHEQPPGKGTGTT